MKVGIISDIHSNVEALSSVLKEAKKEKVNYFFIAGDLIGYYYETPAVIDKLNNLKWYGVKGNHERMFLKSIKVKSFQEKYQKKYGSCFDLLKNFQKKKLINLFKTLPNRKTLRLDGKEILICHGAPWDKDLYLYPDTNKSNLKKLKSYKFDLIIFGHTHRQTIFKFKDKLILNPGSVGQARDYRGKACWAIWDSISNNVKFVRTSYNNKKVMRQCQRNDNKN